MIRTFSLQDLDAVLALWLEGNRGAHPFIPEAYWLENLPAVRELLPQAELYLFTPDSTPEILGFAGLNGTYIEGIFVREDMRSGGIGRQLLNYVKSRKPRLALHVYRKNVRAAAFYEREGFWRREERIDARTGEPEFLMVWERT